MNQFVCRKFANLEMREESDGVPYLFTGELPQGARLVDSWQELELASYEHFREHRLPIPVFVRVRKSIDSQPVYLVNYVDYRNAYSCRLGERYVSEGIVYAINC